MSNKVEQIDPICNMCGYSCRLSDNWEDDVNGLFCSVEGRYSSTPGNGYGALDDCSSYKFALCEFCLDWMFTQFKIPVQVINTLNNVVENKFRSAIQRVAEDDWRKDEEGFYQEYLKRANARSKEHRLVERYRNLQVLK